MLYRLALSFFISAAALSVVSAHAAIGEWTPIGPEGVQAETWLALDPRDGETVYLPAAGGLYVSHDAGTSWDFIALDSQANPFYTSLAFSHQPPHTVFVAWSRGWQWGSTIATLDGGRCCGRYLHWDYRGRSSLGIDPEDPNSLFAGGTNFILRSADGGSNWREIDTQELVTWFWFNPLRRGHMYAGHGGYSVESTDYGVTWTQAFKVNYRGRETRRLVTDVKLGPGGHLYAAADVGGQCVAGYVPGSVLISFDAGVTWSPYEEGIGPDCFQPTVERLEVAPDGSTLYAIGTRDTYARGLGDPEWRKLADFPRNVRVSRSGDGIMYGYRGTALVRSRDHGTTWTDITPGLNLLPISRLAWSGESDRLFAIGAKSLFLHDSAGWQKLSTPAPPLSVLERNGRLVIGTREGTFLSSDSGETWRDTGLRGYGWAIAASSDGSRFWSVIEETGAESGVYSLVHSADRGGSWTKLESLRTGWTSENRVFLEVNPEDEDHIMLQIVDQLFESVDGGISFQERLGEVRVNHFAVDWRNGLILVSAGVRVSEGPILQRLVQADLESWTVKVLSEGGPFLSEIHHHEDREEFYAIARDEVVRSRDGGATWSRMGPPLVGLRTIALTRDRIVAGTLYSGCAELSLPAPRRRAAGRRF